MKIQKPEINHTRSLFAALVAGSALAVTSPVPADDHTSAMIADGNGSVITLDDGDTISVTDNNGHGLFANGGGSIAISPSGGSISVTLAGTVSTGSTAYTVHANGSGNDSGSSIDLGSGSRVVNTVTGTGGSSNIHGIVATNGGSVTAENVSVTLGSPETSLSVSSTRVVGVTSTGSIATGGLASLGTNSSVKIHANNINGDGRVIGVSGAFTATDGLSVEIFAEDLPHVETAIGIQAFNMTGMVNAGTRVTVRSPGRGIQTNNSGAGITVGAGSFIEATEGINASIGGVLNVSGSTINGVGAEGRAVNIGGGTANITGSILSGEKNAIWINDRAYSNLGTAGNLAISGGTINSTTGSLIVANAIPGYSHDNVTTNTVTIDGGAQATSGNGVLFASDSSADAVASVSVIIDGAGTTVAGRFIDGDLTSSLTVRNEATWASAGASNMDTLVLDGANIELTLDSLTDAINATNLTVTGANSLTVGLSNAALADIIVNQGGARDINVLTLITGSSLEGSLEDSLAHIVLKHNDAGSTWSVTDLSAEEGAGWYRINGINFVAVPEPATYAALAGVMLLVACAVIRRRGC
jgi:hypothetical protein